MAKAVHAKGRVQSGSPVMRVAELAETLGVSNKSAYRYIAQGLLPSQALLRVGPRKFLLKRAAVTRWLSGE